MNAGRMTLFVTSMIVAVMAAAFALMQWQDANKVATSVAALAGIAAVGVAIWATLRGSGQKSRIAVRGSGPAVSGPGGKAISGSKLTGDAPSDVTVENSGRADASGGGAAISGVESD